jgi:hypothetical protein
MKLSHIVAPFSLCLSLFGCGGRPGALDLQLGQLEHELEQRDADPGVLGGSSGIVDAGTDPRTLEPSNGDAGGPIAPADPSNGDAPVVTITSPMDGDLRVAIDQALTATFSEPLDPAKLCDMAFTVTRGTTPILGKVTYSANAGTFFLAFDPDDDLAADSEFQGTISVGAADLMGPGLVPTHVWTFTTSSLPTPPK